MIVDLSSYLNKAGLLSNSFTWMVYVYNLLHKHKKQLKYKMKVKSSRFMYVVNEIRNTQTSKQNGLLEKHEFPRGFQSGVNKWLKFLIVMVSRKSKVFQFIN